MAGSYRHCEGDDGSFRFDMIENMGDAYEACEMLYFMVKWLAAYCPEDCPAEQRIVLAEAAYYSHYRDNHGAHHDRTRPMPEMQRNTILDYQHERRRHCDARAMWLLLE